jgi:hypothetical protein
MNDKWIKKMWYLYTMEYYSSIKKNKVMLLQVNGCSWNITLREVQAQKVKSACFTTHAEAILINACTNTYIIIYRQRT